MRALHAPHQAPPSSSSSERTTHAPASGGSGTCARLPAFQHVVRRVGVLSARLGVAGDGLVCRGWRPPVEQEPARRRRRGEERQRHDDEENHASSCYHLHDEDEDTVTMALGATVRKGLGGMGWDTNRRPYARCTSASTPASGRPLPPWRPPPASPTPILTLHTTRAAPHGSDTTHAPHQSYIPPPRPPTAAEAINLVIRVKMLLAEAVVVV
ncbi:hypothetical protein C8R45DRAFT_1109889 [Mycena sanguinolenta]|nr:hypothetical protein C8R45DRAFT_1109889 [Mycena sanguinolenta]